jgi:hypothetical protein
MPEVKGRSEDRLVAAVKGKERQKKERWGYTRFFLRACTSVEAEMTPRRERRRQGGRERGRE